MFLLEELVFHYFLCVNITLNYKHTHTHTKKKMLGFHLLDLLVIPCLNTLSPDSQACCVASRVSRDSVTCPLLEGMGLWSGKGTGGYSLSLRSRAGI